jgi:chromosome segregation ATPase
MNDMATDPRLSMGANNPPQNRAEELALTYKHFLDEATEALAAASKAPDKVDDDETSGKFAELCKKMRAIEVGLETAFDGEKAPHNLAISQIQGFFKTHIASLEVVRKKLAQTNKDYNERKAAAKKREIEEAAEKARKEAEKKKRESADAQQTKDAAAAALVEYERLASDALQAKSHAVSELEQAQAQVAIAEAKLAKVKSDNASLGASFAQRVVDGNAATDEEKSTKRAEAEGNLKAARDDLDAARTLLTEAREKRRAAQEAQRKADDDAAAKMAEVRSAERDIRDTSKEADRQTAQAEKLENKANSDDPSFGSVRSIHGAMATTMTVWKHRVDDVKLLDKDALWHLIDFDAIEVAVGKWGKMQPDDRKKMQGATFYEEVVPVVR